MFLIDENLPTSVGDLFQERGFGVECVVDLPELRGRPDEVIFDYAVKHNAIIVTRDRGFANPFRFELEKLKGIMVLRFPNEITIPTLIDEVKRLTKDLTEKDFYHFKVIIEPGFIRMREL